MYGCSWGPRAGLHLSLRPKAGPEPSGNMTGLLRLPDPTLSLEGKRIKVSVKTDKEREVPKWSEGARPADPRTPTSSCSQACLGAVGMTHV